MPDLRGLDWHRRSSHVLLSCRNGRHWYGGSLIHFDWRRLGNPPGRASDYMRPELGSIIYNTTFCFPFYEGVLQ